MTVRRVALSIVLATCLFGVLSAAAIADGPAPGWEAYPLFWPTNLRPGDHKDRLLINLHNIGAASTQEVTVTDTLPQGVTAMASEATVRGEATPCVNQAANIVVCKPTGISTASGRLEFLPGTEALGIGALLEIPITVEKGLEGMFVNHLAVSGGGAPEVFTRSTPVTVSSTPAPFGFAGAEAWFSNADGTIDTQAGSHPYEVTIAFALNSEFTNQATPIGGEAKRFDVNLPPGLIGDARAMPQCSLQQMEHESVGNAECPASSQVGETAINVPSVAAFWFPVYNMVPPPGVVAQFAFRFAGNITFINAGVRSGGDDGITQQAKDVPEKGITYVTTTIWGVPNEPSHKLIREGIEEEGGYYDGSRICEEYENLRGCPTDAPAVPLLTLPTQCTGKPLAFSVEEVGTYQNESAYASTSNVTRDASGNPVGITGCERLAPFEPSVSIAPDTSQADTPAGLSTEIGFSEDNLQSLFEPEALVSPDLKNTTVTLPQGVAINPGQATGLVACPSSDEDLGNNTVSGEGPANCPAASKVGQVEVESPLVASTLKGGVYILGSNPPNLQLLVTASAEGVNIKLVGDVHLDETTGQLVTTFNETPELPFSRFKLSFSGGAQAALVTPTACGVYTADSDFSPWDTPLTPDFPDSSQFQITSGPGGGPCESQLPFAPVLTAGATTDQAGGFTDFSMLLQRGDGQQRIDGLQFKAPAGLTGFISKVPLCTNAQAESNTCPEASKIGHTVVESGPGPYPLVIPTAGQEPAPIYLTEAYDGAPFGLSIVVPIHAGPFALPTQRVRARIEVDPYTSALTITTGELPQVVAGIPTDLREVDAVIERPEFMVNPTNCGPQEFSGTAFGTPPPGVSEAGKSAAIASHFQVGSCQALKFQPKFTASTQAKTSRVGGASLTAKVSYPSGPQGTYADIAKVKVELPKQLPSRLTTLQKACTSVQFDANPAGCPAASFIGHAVVHTPLLGVPLEGPAIFVSHGGESFPSLTLVLQGEGVTVDLVGATFISKAGVTSTTFKTVPDDPFSTFELTLPEGPYSALTAIGNLCKHSLALPTEFVGQNGAEIHERTKIAITGCPQAKKAKKASHKRKHAKRKTKRASGKRKKG